MIYDFHPFLFLDFRLLLILGGLWFLVFTDSLDGLRPGRRHARPLHTPLAIASTLILILNTYRIHTHDAYVQTIESVSSTAP